MSLVRLKMSDVMDAASRRPAGYMESVLGSAAQANDRYVWLPAQAYEALRAKYAAHRPDGGPGTELKALLGRIGITASPNCACNSRARQMDEWGPDECQRRSDEIVSWLRDQAAARKLPFSEFLAKQLLLLAIRRARSRAAK